jgi:ABC-type uncharacterized transport system substrate-binding protein
VREFIALIGGGAIMLPLASRAQQAPKVHRIAILHPSHPISELTETSSLKYYRAFFQELRRLGYIEGQNAMIERYSGGGNVEHYSELAAEVARRNPDVILAVSPAMAKPLKEVTSTIPIVAISDDPVNAGLVPSLAHPGGNITGASVGAGLELWSKRLQLFRGVIPTMNKVGVLGLRPSAERAAMLEAAENAQIRVVGPSFIDSTDEAEYRRIFAAVSQEGAEALFVDASPVHVTNRQLIIELAEKHRLPAMQLIWRKSFARLPMKLTKFSGVRSPVTFPSINPPHSHSPPISRRRRLSVSQVNPSSSRSPTK